MISPRLRNVIAASLLGVVAVTFGVTQLTAQSLGEKVTATTDEVKEKAQDAGQAAATKLDQLWQQIDEQRLKNRPPAAIAAWLLVGVVVGSILARFTSLVWWTALIFGLVGSFLGSLIVSLTQFDLGFGFILIRYEELLCSLVGAIVMLVIVRFIMASKKKKP